VDSGGLFTGVFLVHAEIGKELFVYAMRWINIAKVQKQVYQYAVTGDQAPVEPMRELETTLEVRSTLRAEGITEKGISDILAELEEKGQASVKIEG